VDVLLLFGRRVLVYTGGSASHTRNPIITSILKKHSVLASRDSSELKFFMKIMTDICWQ
jgi:hypothetical protein